MAQHLAYAPQVQTAWTKKIALLITASLLALAATLGISRATVSAGHNGALVSTDTGACGETTVSAAIADSAGGHKVGNMRLVVDVDGVAEFTNVIPTNGDSVSITVGPFFSASQTISWRVFGGGERGYDQPLWNGFGTPSFGGDINAYAAEVGTFNWVVAGTTDPNPFTTWNSFDVAGCVPEAMEDCKDSGWAAFGFRNQGQCIRFVNTGQDSR